MAASGDHRLDLPLDPSRLNVPALLRQLGLRPEKRLGQNFLIDPTALKRIISVAEVGPADTVLEVGAGLGSLTVLLAERARQVIAVELDAQLIPPLRHVLADRENVHIIQGDILKLDIASLLAAYLPPEQLPERCPEPLEGPVEGTRPERIEGTRPERVEGTRPERVEGPPETETSDTRRSLRQALATPTAPNVQAPAPPTGKAGDYLIVANIPYYITSALIRRLLEAQVRPARMVLTVQREVAERICAQPEKPHLREGGGEMSLLALSVQVYGKPEIAFTIPAGAFYPRPKVDSAVVRIDIFLKPLIPAEQLNVFFSLAKAGFGQKRKTLRNALARGLNLEPGFIEDLLNQAGIDPKRRAETLSLEEWKTLTGFFISETEGHPWSDS